ncbi:DNA polymerase III subunit gamma/tau [Shewanella sp. AS1]|uniref:DNA polymerase III subunit gamma/tau n=1 Tax=Shewanella sp. AS1 TaxID=2907626 RepID=UPI001F24A2C3|nr:DNA polymerase III subunit gamma/tau [Shewanella sp. AS1]MCE9678648.1 DNA polymerase III subunit gamma/tau [Shewanella sp. AS1]
MSYQVLARKWRPAKFEQMVGQSHVLHALTNALMQNRLHHAYLFSGTRGVGKTSLARLFAKGLNCEQGVTAQPCGQCASCVEIAQGRFVDLIEVDAASRTKVDDTRELLDNVQYRPSRGRYKVYLIDEVHMLSRSSFNALLKTLEEPPEHVKFLLATTDPQRLPVTVLSRCLQFNLKSLTLDEISVQLSHILKQEQIHFDEGALTLLAKAANGSMRDALSLTDQAIAFGAGQVQLSQVQTMLGTIDEHYVIVLLKALCDGDIAKLMQVIDEVLSYGAEPVEVLRSLLELLHQITLTQFAPAAAQLSKYAQQIAAFAAQLPPEQVQLYYQLLLTGRKDLPHAPDPKSGLEMAMLRAVAFVPESPAKKWQSEPGKQTAPQDTTVSASGHAPEKLTLPVMPAKSAAPVKSAAPATVKQTVGESQAENEQDSETGPEAENRQETGSTAEASSAKAQHSEKDVDCDDASLLSEQALILSQAASQTQLSKDDTSTSETHVSETHANETNVSDSGQSKASNASSPSLFDAYDEMTPDYGDELAANGQDALDYEAYLASQPSQPSQPSQTDVAAREASQAVSQTAASQVKEAASVAPCSDDLLDAVLAARDSLLSELDVKPSKESDAKKSEVQVKAYVPPKRQTDAGTTQSDKASDDKAIEDKSKDDLDDRPPWEDKPNAAVEVSSLKDVTPENDVTHEQHSELKAKDTTDKAAQEQAISQTQLVSQEPAVSQEQPVSQEQLKPQKSLPDQVLSQHSTQLSVSESITGDSTDLKWYRLMAALEIGGRVRQLAVNSVCQQFSEPLPLVLKPDQKHLEAAAAVAQLEEALSTALGEPCQVSFSVGVVKGRETPLEIRKRFHGELLALAEQELVSDEHIRWLSQAMGAQMVPDSLSYAPERLGQRGQAIELIDKSNFLELAESH